MLSRIIKENVSEMDVSFFRWKEGPQLIIDGQYQSLQLFFTKKSNGISVFLHLWVRKETDTISETLNLFGIPEDGQSQEIQQIQGVVDVIGFLCAPLDSSTV
jgi:hypothetical protein